MLFFLNQYVISQVTKTNFENIDIFALEYVDNPKVSPDGEFVVYERHSFDIMEDKEVSALWITDRLGKSHRKLTSLLLEERSAVWSPSGNRIAFLVPTEAGTEIFIYWVDSRTTAKITQLEYAPSSITWSPDGKFISFSMFVSAAAPAFKIDVKKPKGAKWAEAPRLTTRLKHEADGSGYINDGFHHIFMVDAKGGIPRQLTTGDFHHKGVHSWTKDNKKIIFSANRGPNWEYEFINTNIYSVDVNSRAINQLSANNGPEFNPVVSPNGKEIAYLGFEDKVQTYQVTKLFVMNLNGSNKTLWLNDLDRSIRQIQWRSDSKAIYFSYDDKGNTKIDRISNGGMRYALAENVGGTSIGRPYSSGSFSVSSKKEIFFTHTLPEYPSELAVFSVKNSTTTNLTNLNQDILDYRNLGKVEEVWYKSTVDKRDIQGWIVKPPDYEAGKKYPLLVENHGGPTLNYGFRFSAELQLYAAAGYLVFYPNPRGSTGYGEVFGNLLYNNYPGDDYQDVMDGVDYLIAKELTSEDSLFVTGGSAGGIMTTWMIGKNQRFEAAVVHKPVINWLSKTLVADNYYDYANYRIPGQPWENFAQYWKFSPLSLVGNITTPTMVMVGMNDLRTPPSEAKQLYHALKLRKIETMLVEIPGASHGIANRPSNLINKVSLTISWCDKYRKD